MTASDPRRFSPAAERNRQVILAELQRLLPASGRMLEIASGTGQHAAHCAAALTGWHWQPTEMDPQALAGIDAWCAGLPNCSPACRLDVLEPGWPALPPECRLVDALYCANLLHIAPWACCAALMQGAAARLAPAGQLVLYGPYLLDEQPTAPSNLAFDADLRGRDPAWGLRRLEAVLAQASAVGLRLVEQVAMPANNLMLVLTPAGPAGG
jgi:hypothetical protein